MDEKKTRVATIFDVARLAGVSHQTVSRVLNDLPNVKPSTKERVELAIKQLRYVPSPVARALVTRRSRTIGLIATGSPNFGPSSILLGFNEAAREARYAVSMANILDADATSVRAAFDLLLRQNVEAIVLIAERTSVFEAIASAEIGVPLLAVEPIKRRGFHSVAIDQYAGARSAVRHLLSLGHTKILHLSGPADAVDSIARVNGWRDEMSSHGLLMREPMVGDWSPNSGYNLGRALERNGDFTAIFAGNDQMALGLIHGLSDIGLSVPNDVSVVGFDDIPESEHFSPPLTTMRQDFAALGREIMDGLLDILHDEDAPDRVQAVPQLIIRSSATRPRA